MKNFLKSIVVTLLLLHFGFGADAVIDNVVALQKPGTIGLVTRMDVNKVDLALNNAGSTGQDGDSFYPKGSGLSFLFAGGIGASGYVDGDLRTAWTISASRIEEFVPGKWGMDPDDARAKFYIVTKDDDFGSAAYQDWATAVELGADFQDLNGDGQYDPNVDRPDLIGDKIIWTVFNDGSTANERQRLQTQPMGIEVHQQLWGFDRGDALGDVVFIRYRLINQGGTDIEDFIFSAVMDPDLGDYRDDLIGCDTLLSLGFIYNDGDDGNYGPNPPAFGLDFFQGPVVDAPGDTAFLYRGPFLGIDTLPDMRNLGLTSFMYYIQSHPTIGDPNDASEARNYQVGGVDRTGARINPVTFGFGTGATADTDPRFLYSGDPVTGTGWLDDPPDDKRFMVNSGPFQLAANDTQDVVIAYIVAQGNNALNSVSLLKEEDLIAQTAYNANFFVAGPPPAASYEVRNLDNKVDIVLDLKPWFDYDVTDKLLNRQVWEGFTIYQFNSPNVSNQVNGIENAKAIAQFDLKNQYGDLYEDTKQGRIRVWTGQNNLDPAKYADENSRNFRYTVETDAFDPDGGPLVNGKEYYFAVIPFSMDVNHVAKNTLTTSVENDWYFTLAGGFLQPSRTSGFFTARPGGSTFKPFRDINSSQAGIDHPSGNSEGFVQVSVVDHEALTGDNYEISFFGNGEFWKITNTTDNMVVLDSIFVQGTEGDEWNFPIVDGMSVRVYNQIDSIKNVEASAADSVWVEGRGADTSPLGEFKTFNGGVNYAKYAFPDLADSVMRDDYFPVRVVIDTSLTSKGFWYRSASPNYNRFQDIAQIPVSAFDISDPDNPRKLNIIFNSIRGDIPFSSGNNTVMLLTTTSYDTTIDYASNGINDAYLALNLVAAEGKEPQTNVNELTITPTFVNSDADVFSFSSAVLGEELSVQQRKDVLESARVVPNPYFAYSSYESSYDTPVIKFTHIDQVATIRIFNLAGQLVKTIKKNGERNEVSWDLRNEAGLKVSSGMYIAHIEVPGVGNKVLKFGIVQREERIDRY